MPWVIHIRISPYSSLPFGENIPKKDQVAVQFCLTSIMGLVVSSSLSTTSSSACFSLSFFFFFFLTGSPSSTAVPSVPQKGQKWKAGCQLLRVQKKKLQDVRGCNDSYSLSVLTYLQNYFLLEPKYTTTSDMSDSVQAAQFTSPDEFTSCYSYMLLPGFKRSLHVFICLPKYLQVLHWKSDYPQFDKYFYQQHRSSKKTLKSPLRNTFSQQ